MSLATASRVLNGSTRQVAQSYRVRVEAAAEKLGYTPNLSAQATARGTSAMVALLVSDIADATVARLAAGVARAAEEAGLVVTIGITDRDPQREARLVRSLRGQRPRGLILASSRTSGGDDSALRSELEAYAGMGGRAVLLGERGTGGLAVDERAAAESLGRELAGLGYRQAVVLAAPAGMRSSDERAKGFTDGFTAGGGALREVRRTGFRRDDGYAAAQQLLDDGLPPATLVFAVTDVVAIGAASAFRDAGRVVGTDVAVAGFDDVEAGRDIRPALTTVHVPWEELGAQALRTVVGGESDAAASVLSLDVIIRESTPAGT